ncbi:deaminase [Ahniella affigens]|uniref:Deaminase n=1 Tax=Ahniella affigens TaxID=2021234 RepID=A0A2P1PPT6_9GAMM|nr:dihydrofolate reductase family protein [Ahniella affigens]AVP96861.1 deaminase [Ahniella affigens]
MTERTSRVRIHMAASLDGFVTRPDGQVDWLETEDAFPEGRELTQELIAAFLDNIDCYVMGARTYETALQFEQSGLGWVYGDKPVYVVSQRALPINRANVHRHSGSLTALVTDALRPRFQSIWVAGGPMLAAEMLRLGLADEVSISIAPVLIGRGLPFFAGIEADIRLHLLEVQAYRSGMVELRYAIQRPR